MREGTRKSRAPSGDRGGQDRRLEFVEARPFMRRAHRIDHLAAQHDVVVELLAPQVEEAISQPRILGIRLVAEHRQRQFAGWPQHFDLTDINLDAARRHCPGFSVPAGRLRTLPSSRTTHSERSFSASEGRRIRIDHALGQAVMVAQIDEQHAAMVADAVAPAGQADVCAVLGEGQGAAGVGAVAMHDCRSFRFRRGARS